MKERAPFANLRIGFFILIFLLVASTVFSQRKKDKKEPEKTPATTAIATPEKKDEKTGIQPYEKIITAKAKTDAGLFTYHEVEGKFYFEIPDSLLDREILLVSRIAGFVDGLNFGGAGMEAKGEQVIRWQKSGKQLLLRYVSHTSIANHEEPIYQSVRNNNFEPVVMAFELKAIKKDSAAYVIDIEEFFTTDVEMIAPLDVDQRKDFGVKSLDKKRSLISGVKSFPMNTEVRHVLTYAATNPPSNKSTGTLSLEMNQSFVLLPKIPTQPRLQDDRVGYFSVSQIDYSSDEQKSATRKFITRWKLIPKDIEAYKRGELVEPIKPIVYYIDPATPEKWRPFIKQGIEDWKVAFERAGFKNAIMAKDPPAKAEDPDWSPEDVRYSVIRYITTTIQNAQGPHVHDPRSGEIIESDIMWYHNVMNLLRNWYFVQTAAINPDARNVKFKDEVMGRLIRFVAAHEVGHTLGLPHNWGSSVAYPVDSLRSASFTRKSGTAPSIMDYARFNYVAQPEDKGVTLMPDIGEYDKYAIAWGYRYLPDAKSADDEKSTLNKWITDRANNPVYFYGRQTGALIDPRSQSEDIGNDAMKSSSYGVANLKRIVPNLIQWTHEDGKDYDDLQELYGNVIAQWNRYSGHVRSNIGGVYETFKSYEQPGNVFVPVPKDIQKKAMVYLQKETFATPEWLLDENILKKIEHAGSLERLRSAQSGSLNSLLDPGRIARLMEAEAALGSATYTPLEMFVELRTGLWSELPTGKKIDAYRRNLQRAYIERMEFLMKDSPASGPQPARIPGNTNVNVSQSDIRPIVRAELKALRSQINLSLPAMRDNLSRYHLEDAVQRINLILDPK